MKNYEFSKKPLDYVYAAVWLIGFAVFAVWTLTGNIFEPSNGKIHIVAILIGWIAEFISLWGAAVLIFLIGLFIALKIILKKKTGV
jgi:hypothetical protein